MGRSDFRLLEPLHVPRCRGHAGNVIANPQHLLDVEVALAHYWRAMALPCPSTLADLGGGLLLRHATFDYRAPARDDDPLTSGLRCSGIGKSLLRFDGAIFRGDEQIAGAHWVHVYIDVLLHAPQRVPPLLRTALLAFEAGEPMVAVRTGAWSALRTKASAIRTEVFVAEQGIPAELEWDEADFDGVHAVAENRLGAAVGTARLLAYAPGVVKIGRMAVQRALRGQGIGRLLLETLTAAARERGERAVLLHAQLTAEAFYRAAGYERRGEPFEEAGLPHVEMVRQLWR